MASNADVMIRITSWLRFQVNLERSRIYGITLMPKSADVSGNGPDNLPSVLALAFSLQSGCSSSVDIDALRRSAIGGNFDQESGNL